MNSRDRSTTLARSVAHGHSARGVWPLFLNLHTGDIMVRITLLLGLIVLPAAALAQEMPQAARDLGCLNCHDLDNRSTGPAFRAIAKRYHAARNDPETARRLVRNISLGSQGNWNDFLPMVANDPTGKKRDQIQNLVNFILALPPQQAPDTTAQHGNPQ